MDVHGLDIVEGGVIENLTVDSGATLPANGARGELFVSVGNADQDLHPDGLHFHDGAAWDNLPTVAQVESLINDALGAGSEKYFQTVFNIRTLVGANGLGNYWAVSDSAVLAVSGAFNAIVMSSFWYDPADYPLGTKFRLSVTANQSNTASSMIVDVGLCKVLRPSTTGGATTQMIYTPDTPDVAAVVVPALLSKTQTNYYTEEFTMPSEAGQYCFHLNLRNTNGNAGTHYEMRLQAKY